MSPVGLALGWFSPRNEIGDVARFCERVREICGPVSSAFPFVRHPLKDADGATGLFYGVIGGLVPVHLERPNAAESCSQMFTFVLEAEERPVLLFAPAGQREAGCILQPRETKVASMGFGAVELWAGKALHFDVARAFVGITGFPTGDPVPTTPSAVVVQVPWPNASDIAGAIWSMKRQILADERFNDLTGQGEGTADEIRRD